MCKVPVKLRALVKQRLDAAAEEIFELLERTITEYEEEAARQKRLMETLLQPRVLLNKTTAISDQPAKGSPSHPQDPHPLHIKEEEEPLPTHIKEEEEPLPTHIKEEQEEAGSSQDALYRDIVMSQLWKRGDTAPSSEFDEVLTTTRVSMKSKEEEASETWTHPVQHNETVAGPEPPVPVAATRQFICSFCPKVFDSKYHLQIHMRVHTGERPFSCPVCGKKFTQKGTLTTHLFIHSELKQFICSICGKRFAQKTGLNSHILLHSGEKPFSCSVCGKKFALKGNMEQHMMIHSGLKPYNCTVCGKAFAHKCSLNNHILVHTGEKPFRCSVCGIHFRKRSNLNQHMSTHG